MTDINLLPEEEKAAESFAHLTKRLTHASIAMLVLTAVATLVILVFFILVASSRSKLISQIGDSTVTINSFKNNEELQFVSKSKVSAAEQILSARVDMPNIFGKLASLVPQNVYFSDVKFSGNKVVLGGKAKTSADMAGLISSLVSSSGAEILSLVTVDSLVSDDNGVYSFTLSAQVVKSEQ